MHRTRYDALLETGYDRVARPLVFRTGDGDAEAAHRAAMRALARLSRSPRALRVVAAALRTDPVPVDVLGLRFPHRVGLAAGMDKDGEAVPAWAALGFGHVELGTVTPRAQPGNPAPRMFRLVRSRAVINRMGFNNGGVTVLADRLRGVRAAGGPGVPVGVSIGKNRDTPVEQAPADYLACVDALHGLADYLAVNVSSPNTPGLRTLQDAGPLAELLTAVVSRTRELAGDAVPVPVLVKLSPDLSEPALDEALEVATGAGVAGVIATNTTLSRDGVSPVEQALAAQAGGLSGAPLTRRALQVVTHVARHTDLPVVGVGGVMTPDEGRRLLDAGAALVQVYTGLVYAGPALVRGLARL